MDGWMDGWMDGRGGEGGTNCLTDRVKLDQKGGEIFKYTFLSASWDSGGN